MLTVAGSPLPRPICRLLVKAREKAMNPTPFHHSHSPPVLRNAFAKRYLTLPSLGAAAVAALEDLREEGNYEKHQCVNDQWKMHRVNGEKKSGGGIKINS